MFGKIRSFVGILKKLTEILTRQQKLASVGVFCLMVFCSFLELLSVSSVLPFIYAILEPEKVANNKYVKAVVDFLHLNITNKYTIVIYMGALIVIAFVVRSAALIFSNYKRICYENKILKEITNHMMEAYLKRPYEDMIHISSARALRGVTVSANSVYAVLQKYFLIFANSLTILLILIFLTYINPVMVLELAICAGVTVGVLLLVLQKKISEAGQKFNASAYKFSKNITETIRGIKEITVQRKKNIFLDKIKGASEEKREAEIRNNFVQYIPAVVIQTVFVCIIIVVACIQIRQGTAKNDLISTLSTFAYGVVQILPAVSMIVASINGILYSYQSFMDAYDNITEAKRYGQGEVTEGKNEQSVSAKRKSEKFRQKNEITELGKTTGKNNPAFQSVLRIEHLTWKYQNAEEAVLENLDLTIHRGECVGLIGKSGAGKTTLADVILGLLKPHGESQVLADGKDIFSMPDEWAHTVGYVPQSTFLSDDTIRHNILFGGEPTKENETLIWNALEQAQMKKFIEALPNGIDTVIGEGGAILSGGQRQRLTIARALFNNPEILVLDEATSALDNETEEAVMKSIEHLLGKKTIIIIAHRLSTIEKCDTVYEIKEGKAVRRTDLGNSV